MGQRRTEKEHFFRCRQRRGWTAVDNLTGALHRDHQTRGTDLEWLREYAQSGRSFERSRRRRMSSEGFRGDWTGQSGCGQENSDAGCPLLPSPSVRRRLRSRDCPSSRRCRPDDHRSRHAAHVLQHDWRLTVRRHRLFSVLHYGKGRTQGCSRLTPQRGPSSRELARLVLSAFRPRSYHACGGSWPMQDPT